jgi:hypothetical protein
MKTKLEIEIDTEDAHELSTIHRMIQGYLHKRDIKFLAMSFTKMDDGRQLTVVGV